jgi:hypothetical protein
MIPKHRRTNGEGSMVFTDYLWRTSVTASTFGAFLLLILTWPTATYAQEEPSGTAWALVIGVNSYANISRLNYAVSDAAEVAKLLPGLRFAQNKIRLLVDDQATKARIEETLYRDFAAMGPEDRLFVYFAGHGETLAIRDGEEGFLLPVDADPAALPLTAISMNDVRRIAQRLKAKHFLFVMDACFSGFALTRDPPKHTTPDHIRFILREPAVQVITAGRRGEKAIEEAGHGLFTRRLIEGLRGAADTEGLGFLTAGQLAAWIETRVLRDSGGKMTPQYGRLDGEGQFVFFLRPRAAPPGLPATSESTRLTEHLAASVSRGQDLPGFRVTVDRVTATGGSKPKVSIVLSYSNKTEEHLRIGLCYPRTRQTARVVDDSGEEYRFLNGAGIGDVCTGEAQPLTLPARGTIRATLNFERSRSSAAKPSTYSLVTEHVVVDYDGRGLQILERHVLSLPDMRPK